MVSVAQGSEATVARFNRLVTDLLEGRSGRNAFEPWEIEILLDIDSCRMQPSAKKARLRRYQRAVNRAFGKGRSHLFLFTEYLNGRKSI